MLKKNNTIKFIVFVLKWLCISGVLGIIIGSASAFFLITLEVTTNFRILHPWLIWGLPIGGFIVGYAYYKYGGKVVAGNNLIIQNINEPEQAKIQFRMAPMVYIGTLITHFFGGSAGREGTALQMAGAIADQFTRPLELDKASRKVLLIAAVAAGFGAVFGTPLAGVLFGLEFFLIGRIRYQALFPALIAALVADSICTILGAKHTHYEVSVVPALAMLPIIYSLIFGLVCGVVSKLFSESMHALTSFYNQKIKYPPFRPLVGGILVAVLVLLFSAYEYTGLGVSVIQSAFEKELSGYTFLLKIFFTVLTLSAGFKGGEVTPLFFIGATLGNAAAYIIPLPMSLLAGMGFVAVFAGATNTPLACMLMAVELFGAESAAYMVIACVTAYLFSGKSTIYSAQVFEDEL